MSNCKLYSNDYIEWKEWDLNKFAIPEESEIAYFKAELLRADVKFGKELSVLEIGFGNGAFLGFCTTMGWKVVGIEVNRDLIERGKAAGLNVYDSSEIGRLSKQSFDVVVALDVIEHLQLSEQYELFNTVNGLLKTGGVFLARFPNGDSTMGLRHQNGDETHVSQIGSLKATMIAKKCGFASPQIYGQAIPVREIGVIRSLVNQMRRLVLSALDCLLMLIFHPRILVVYSSMNLVLVCKKSISGSMNIPVK